MALVAPFPQRLATTLPAVNNEVPIMTDLPRRSPRVEAGDAARPGPRRPAWLAVGGSVAALLAVTGVATTVDTAAPAPRTVALQSAALRACPTIPATPVTLYAQAAAGQLQVARLDGGGAATDVDSPLVVPDLTTGVTIRAADGESAVIGGVHAASNGQAWWGACQTSQAVQYLQFVDGASATLLLANPDVAEASVDVGLSDPNGEVQTQGLRDLRVPARSSADNGSDFAAATTLGRSLLAVGVPGGAVETRLILSNPATTRTKVRVEVLGAGGSVVPVGADALAVEAGQTTQFDLTTAVGGEAAAVRVTGPDEVAFTVSSRLDSDLGYLPALGLGRAPTLTMATPIAAPGTLSLTNVHDEPTEVSVTWGGGAPPLRVTLAPRSTQPVPVPDGATSVVVTADKQVLGAVVLAAGPAAGLAVAQLQPADAAEATVPLIVDPRTGR